MRGSAAWKTELVEDEVIVPGPESLKGKITILIRLTITTLKREKVLNIRNEFNFNMPELPLDYCERLLISNFKAHAMEITKERTIAKHGDGNYLYEIIETDEIQKFDLNNIFNFELEYPEN